MNRPSAQSFQKETQERFKQCSSSANKCSEFKTNNWKGADEEARFDLNAVLWCFGWVLFVIFDVGLDCASFLHPPDEHETICFRLVYFAHGFWFVPAWDLRFCLFAIHFAVCFAQSRFVVWTALFESLRVACILEIRSILGSSDVSHFGWCLSILILLRFYCAVFVAHSSVRVVSFVAKSRSFVLFSCCCTASL